MSFIARRIGSCLNLTGATSAISRQPYLKIRITNIADWLKNELSIVAE